MLVVAILFHYYCINKYIWCSSKLQFLHKNNPKLQNVLFYYAPMYQFILLFVEMILFRHFQYISDMQNGTFDSQWLKSELAIIII